MSAEVASGSQMMDSQLDNRIFPTASTGEGDNHPSQLDTGDDDDYHQQHKDQMGNGNADYDDEGVEVVLEGSGKSSIIDVTSRPSQDQNVFRAPHPVRPRAIRGGHPPPPGSYGYGGGPPPSHPHHPSSYGPPPPHHYGGDYRQMQPPPHHGGPYPVPYGRSSGSFDHEGPGASYPGPPPTSHYSPHVQYPPPGGRRPHDDVNVISPNHKDHSGAPHTMGHHPHGPPHHPPMTPRSSGSNRYGAPSVSNYHYPPTSPVSRPGGPPTSSSSPPRMRGYGMRRPEGPYAAAQRGRDSDPSSSTGLGVGGGGSWAYPTPDRSSRPPLVTESSFDSDPYSSHASHSSSHPTTPNAPHYGGPPLPTSHHSHHSNGSSDHHHHHSQQPHYGGGYGDGSFDSHGHGSGHPPNTTSSGYYDDPRGPPGPYYGHSTASHHPPHHSETSPYSPHSYEYSPGGGYYDAYPPSFYGRGGPRSYDEHDRYYNYHHDPHHDPRMKKDEKSGLILPKAASEVDFDISDPPLEPTTPPSTQPVCESPADVNSYDVLCGRGGGTNSQVGNRRFRKLVQDFQPIYLLARRKEKPLLARTIVLIIRKRGGRFLKKDEETGELYEVGDQKAEAKTSQALREGLDVRATKSAASLMDKKKKKKSSTSSAEDEDDDEDDDPAANSPVGPNSSQQTNEGPGGAESTSGQESKMVSPAGADGSDESPLDNKGGNSSGSHNNGTKKDRSSSGGASSPPTLPKFHGEEGGPPKASMNASPTNAPPSPEQIQFRKRRRMRSADGGVDLDLPGGAIGCGVTNPFQSDKLFPDFCPPRADLARAASPPPHGMDHNMDVGTTPLGHHSTIYAEDDDDIRYEHDTPGASSGCAGIALDMMTGAAAGSFCIGPRQWR